MGNWDAARQACWSQPLIHNTISLLIYHLEITTSQSPVAESIWEQRLQLLQNAPEYEVLQGHIFGSSEAAWSLIVAGEGQVERKICYKQSHKAGLTWQDTGIGIKPLNNAGWLQKDNEKSNYIATDHVTWSMLWENDENMGSDKSVYSWSDS